MAAMEATKGLTMGIVDKVISAVTPPESDEARAEARMKARSMATSGGWLEMVLDHHLQIESAFAAVRSATDPATRRTAQKRLGIILTGHSIAEEGVLYPALADNGEKGHSGTAYTEQSAAKVQMALLDTFEPMSEDYMDKFGHLEGAVLHHMYAEEGNWFIDLQEKLPAAKQAMLAMRYREEFTRYMGADATA